MDENNIQDNQSNDVQDPPKNLLGKIKHLGTGIIIAGSIVGSGELIATTLVGAKAGFILMWLIIVGCVIKVFAQVEFGRHTMIWSKTPLKALDDIPGPRFKVKWILWYWLAMMMLISTQQGGILGGIGQALTMVKPLSTEAEVYNKQVSDKISYTVKSAMSTEAVKSEEVVEVPEVTAERPHDVKTYAIIVAILTSIMLYFGRFGLVQWFSTIMVFGFTIVTFVNLIMLQSDPQWAVTFADIVSGLKFSLSDGEGINMTSVAVALSAFGLIGVGASELIMYPYWCLEKGYAKFTGVRDNTPEWLARAKGWIEVMKMDAWASMFVYTFSTLAFYLMGATILHRVGLVPEDGDLIATLGEMYVPVFGQWAQTVFVVGAISVLYSTFFVAAAGNARVLADGLGLFGFIPNDEKSRMEWSRKFCGIWPLAALGLYLFFSSPVAMVLWSGIAQSLMLPMVGFAALYFRYKRTMDELKPGRVWDAFLWLSVAGMFVVGFWTAYSKLFG
ncbi:MAG: hypothetical protein NE330_17350 [Lentisphaeraceae bacterium]|nr:hypothetical protein [Lentisphaeraceae bacterium]